MPDLSHLPEVDDTEKGTDWQSSVKDAGSKAAEAVKDLIERETKDKGKGKEQDKDDGDKRDPKTPAEPRASEIPKIEIPPPTPTAPAHANPATLVVGGLALLALILLLLRRR